MSTPWQHGALVVEELLTSRRAVLHASNWCSMPPNLNDRHLRESSQKQIHCDAVDCMPACLITLNVEHRTADE